MIIPRERLPLEDLMNNKSKMEKLNPILRQEIYDFCRNHYNLKRKEKKIDNLKKKIKEEQVNMRKISKRLTKEYHYIKDQLSIGKHPVYISPEMKGNSYRLDINYRGVRRKLTIGSSIRDLNNLCKKHNKRFDEKINHDNWKGLVNKYLRNYLRNKVQSVTRDEFEDCGRIIINKKTLEFELLIRKDELEKRSGKPKKKKSVPDNSRNSGLGGSRGVVGNQGWNSGVSTSDDTPLGVKLIKDKESSKVTKMLYDIGRKGNRKIKK